MSCSNPMIAIPVQGKYTANHKPVYKFLSSRGVRTIEDAQIYWPDAKLVSCGQCMECRLAHSRQWADRMMLELEEQKKAIFLTLTYDNKHMPVSEYESVVCIDMLPRSPNEILLNGEYLIPKYGSLRKRDIQLFLKRLRKQFPDVKLRYYCAGEYGDKTLRPHYHMILYGIGLEDFKLCERGVFCSDCTCSEEKYRLCRKSMFAIPAGKNELGDRYYTSPKLESIWKNGNILFSDVSWKTCAYVARYVTKKWNGDWKLDYMVRNCEPEFSVQSRRPGIGRAYFDKHPELLDFDSIYLSTPDGGIKMNVPKYFLRVADTEFVKKDGHFVDNPLYQPDKCDMINTRNLDRALNTQKLRSAETTLCQIDYLKMSEQSKFESVKALKRNKL